MTKEELQKARKNYEEIIKGRKGHWFDPGEYEDLKMQWFDTYALRMIEELESVMEELKNKCDKAASLIANARNLLKEVQPFLKLECDKREMKKIITDLAWANENATVIGWHQIGEIMEDRMGYDN